MAPHSTDDKKSTERVYIHHNSFPWRSLIWAIAVVIIVYLARHSY